MWVNIFADKGFEPSQSLMLFSSSIRTKIVNENYEDASTLLFHFLELVYEWEQDWYTKITIGSFHSFNLFISRRYSLLSLANRTSNPFLHKHETRLLKTSSENVMISFIKTNKNKQKTNRYLVMFAIITAIIVQLIRYNR